MHSGMFLPTAPGETGAAVPPEDWTGSGVRALGSALVVLRWFGSAVIVSFGSAVPGAFWVVDELLVPVVDGTAVRVEEAFGSVGVDRS